MMIMMSQVFWRRSLAFGLVGVEALLNLTDYYRSGLRDKIRFLFVFI